MTDRSSLPRRTGVRWATALIGLLFLAIAGYLALQALQPGSGIGTWIAVLVIGALGADSLIAALRARASLLMRIGPLP